MNDAVKGVACEPISGCTKAQSDSKLVLIFVYEVS